MNGRSARVYVVMGDGELAEGSVWEGAMSASQYKLDNLTAVVDRNRLQISGTTEDVMHQDSVEERFKAFGWNVLSVAGNDVEAMNAAFDEAKTREGRSDTDRGQHHQGLRFSGHGKQGVLASSRTDTGRIRPDHERSERKRGGGAS